MHPYLSIVELLFWNSVASASITRKFCCWFMQYFYLYLLFIIKIFSNIDFSEKNKGDLGVYLRNLPWRVEGYYKFLYILFTFCAHFKGFLSLSRQGFAHFKLVVKRAV